MADLIAHLRAGVYTCAAGGTILLYDMLLTSKDEIRLIWPSRFSLVKCLYLVVSLSPSALSNLPTEPAIPIPKSRSQTSWGFIKAMY